MTRREISRALAGARAGWPGRWLVAVACCAAIAVLGRRP